MSQEQKQEGAKVSDMFSDGNNQIAHPHCPRDQIEYHVRLGTPSQTGTSQKTRKISKITNEDIVNEIKKKLMWYAMWSA